MSETLVGWLYAAGMVLWVLGWLAWMAVTEEWEGLPVALITASAWPVCLALGAVCGLGWLYVLGVQKIARRIRVRAMEEP